MKEELDNIDDFTIEAFQAEILRINSELIKRMFDTSSGYIGFGDFVERSDVNIKQQIAILSSMTKEEKEYPLILNEHRLQRIANGSGTTVIHVEFMMEQYRLWRERKLKIKPKPPNNDLPPAVSARMPIPEPPIFTKAVGRKYR